ncbi:hypothetical protein [Virgibacillus sp. 19R1-5]|nr:hypothetical protein [Virgibacillus sp. 19R1-5]
MTNQELEQKLREATRKLESERKERKILEQFIAKRIARTPRPFIRHALRS